MFSDDTLRAFLNGNLAQTETDAIITAMEADPALEEKVMALDDLMEPVRAAMTALPHGDQMDKIKSLISEKSEPTEAPRRDFLRLVVPMAASLAVGVGVGSFFLRKEADPFQITMSWRHEAARYQALYVAETVKYLNHSPNDVAVQMERASDALGRTLPSDALMKVAGMEMLRAQVLGFNGIPVVQVVFRTKENTPIALCMIKKPGGKNPAAPKSVNRLGMASVDWTDNQLDFMLIGGKDQEALDKAAEVISASFA